jgi:nucleotide-binding universal stress UspA family protein
MFTKVLTATDMFEACDAAVIAALEIAKQHDGKLYVLHVLEPSYFHECGPLEPVKHFKTGEETPSTQEYRETVRKELDKKCAGALKTYGNYQIHIAYGKPSIEIRRWSRKFGADLILLGPHAGNIEEEKALIGTPIGNTVEDVIMNTTIPVMIIGQPIPLQKLNFKKIMVCIDFSKSCKYACDFGAKLALKYESKLFLFHMTTGSGSEKDTQKKMMEFCEIPKELQQVYEIWEGAEPFADILKYSREKDIDLLVMGSRTKERGQRAYLGSAVDQVSAESLCPVVVVTHPDALSKLD